MEFDLQSYFYQITHNYLAIFVINIFIILFLLLLSQTRNFSLFFQFPNQISHLKLFFFIYLIFISLLFLLFHFFPVLNFYFSLLFVFFLFFLNQFIYFTLFYFITFIY